MKKEFDGESFGSNCPKNWEEIVDYLNSLLDDSMDCDDAELIWEKYCRGDYSDAPVADFSE